MRQITCAAIAVLMTAALACSPRDRQETANTADAAVDEVRDETREGAGEIREGAEEVRGEARDFAYADRNDFRSDLDLRLKGLDEEIAELERSTKRGVDKSRDSALVNIREARQAVSRNLDRLGSAAESNWDEVKRSVNESVYALDQAVRRQRPDARPMGGTGPS